MHGAVRGVSLLIISAISCAHGHLQTSVFVKPDCICVLGEFSEERLPSTETLLLYANWIGPEHYDVDKFDRFGIERYRRHDYNGAYQFPSDIFALGCTAIEVCPPDPSFRATILTSPRSIQVLLLTRCVFPTTRPRLSMT